MTRQHLCHPAERIPAERIHQPGILLGHTSLAQGELIVLVVGWGRSTRRLLSSVTVTLSWTQQLEAPHPLPGACPAPRSCSQNRALR